MRLLPKSAFFSVAGGRCSGYTLVEILVAMTLTLMLMTAVVTVFGGVGDGISKSRRATEQFDRLRTAAQQLRSDLQGVTVTLDGHPTRPEQNQGYFEYIEGGILSVPQWSVSSGVPVVLSSGTPAAVNLATSGSASLDLSVGERGDILMFTTRNSIRPFVGRLDPSLNPPNSTLQSDVAEVAWFLRGKTLHRRVLLVAPGLAQNANFSNLQRYLGSQTNPTSYYATSDVSARMVGGTFKSNQWTPTPQLVPNSLADLTKRENRFAHVYSAALGQKQLNSFPFDVRAWGVLGLPTLYECSTYSWLMGSPNPYTTTPPNWVSGSTPPPPKPGSVNQVPNNISSMDYWDNVNITDTFNPSGTTSPDQFLTLGTSGSGTRLADDVILTNVIGFDVKAWDPGAPVRLDANGIAVAPGAPSYPPTGQIVSYGAYVDLGWDIYNPSYIPASGAPTPVFNSYNGSAQPGSGLVMNAGTPRVYDSYCFSYENEGIYNYAPDPNSGNVGPVVLPPGSGSYPAGLGQWPAGTSTNGLDDDGDGIVDDISECITQPPYPVALRGIQITIRCYEPDSHQVRQITIENDFLPK